MTGLDPEREVIIEIASLVTDSDLNILAEGPNLAIWQPEEILANMDQWTQRTHTDSGLVDRVRASQYSVDEAAERTLVKYMPKLEDYLHYRILDVSTVKELAQRWYPEEFMERPRKNDDHQALADIRASVDALRYYRDAIFRSDDY